ncbi:MAG TPA: hypothetical protein VIW69_19540 [Candidatus Elarobacter sp.]
MNRTNIVTALVCAAALAGCTSGNTAVPPGQTSVNPIASNVLEFTVGTANIAGFTGLNTVVSYRQPNGLDGTLLNTPTIAGPAGFVNSTAAAQSGNDAGTNTISGSPQPLPAGTAAAATTLGTSGGAFAYGFQPANSTTAGGVSFTRYALPIYAVGTTSPYTTITPAATPVAMPYIGGPPFFPNVRDGTFPSGFLGYPIGFTDFRLAPAAGSYTLTLNVPTGFDRNGNPTSANVSASATLASLVPLPTFATPVFTPDGTGGGTIAVTVPAGVTEALVILQDRDGVCYPGANGAPAYFGFRTTTVGAQVIAVPNRMGPTFGSQTSTPTICTSAQNTPTGGPVVAGDRFRVYAVGFDYPALEAGPPGNRLQAPAIAGATGQSDVTTSAIGVGTSI